MRGVCALLVLCVALCAAAAAAAADLEAVRRDLGVAQRALAHLGRVGEHHHARSREPQQQQQQRVLAPQRAELRAVGENKWACALCGIAVNEVEGMLVENRTMSDIQQFIKDDVCAKLPSGLAQGACDLLVAALPSALSGIENRWDVSRVCIDLGVCDKPFDDHHVDPVQLPTFTVNLDLPPAQRWAQVCAQPAYRANWADLIDTVGSLLSHNGTVVDDFGKTINALLPQEYADEIVGCADALGIGYGWVTLVNIGYEVSDACTSILAQAPDGSILHTRNMDFWAGMAFTATLKNLSIIVDFQSAGKTVFKSVTFAGYVGALSGQLPGVFSVTVDTRFYPEGLYELFEEVIAAIKERGAKLVGFLARDALSQSTTFKDAVTMLSTTELVADVYYIVAGVSAGEGVVLSRARLNASDEWWLDAPQRWFEVETNYDHWKPAPWFDDRRDPANERMTALGQSAVTLQGMFNVLSQKPSLNLQTTYTIVSQPKTGTWNGWARYCPYPCVE